MLQTTVVENFGTHFLFNNIFENRAVDEIMWKNIADSGITDDNMAYAQCMLDKQGCRHTLRICNTY
jgi:hypothetical protein